MSSFVGCLLSLPGWGSDVLSSKGTPGESGDLCGQNISSWDLRFNRSLSRQGRRDLPSKAGRDYPVGL